MWTLAMFTKIVIIDLLNTGTCCGSFVPNFHSIFWRMFPLKKRDSSVGWFSHFLNLVNETEPKKIAEWPSGFQRIFLKDFLWIWGSSIKYFPIFLRIFLMICKGFYFDCKRNISVYLPFVNWCFTKVPDRCLDVKKWKNFEYFISKIQTKHPTDGWQNILPAFLTLWPINSYN